MQRSLVIKIVLILFLVLLLVVPLTLIRGIVTERQQLRDGVIRELAATGVSAQKVIGPLVTVEYRRKVRTSVTDAAAGKTTVTERWESGERRFFPEELSVDGDVVTEERSRGIYNALMYSATLAITGRFELPESFGVAPRDDYEWGTATLVVGIADTRGIRSGLALAWDGEARDFLPGVTTAIVATGIHAPLGRLAPARSYRFTLKLPLKGMQGLEIAPVGRTTRVALASPWPHPSFSGQYLPDTRTIGGAGFSAEWRTSHLATGIAQQLSRCQANDCRELQRNTLGVNFVQPVDVYLQADRALKYGLLFIALTFVAFFLFEVLKRLAIHPVQYALVGVALALFFLLLISLSEHVAFAVAYLVASGASVALLGFYVSHVLASARRGTAFATALAALYGLLYVILRAEDFALLMGSITVFGIVALVMTLTRRVDWYRIGGEVQAD